MLCTYPHRLYFCESNIQPDNYATANSSPAHSVIPFLKKGSWAPLNTLLDRFGKSRCRRVPPAVLAEVPTQSLTCQRHRQNHATYPLTAAAIYISDIYKYSSDRATSVNRCSKTQEPPHAPTPPPPARHFAAAPSGLPRAEPARRLPAVPPCCARGS